MPGEEGLLAGRFCEYLGPEGAVADAVEGSLVVCGGT